MIKYIVLFQFKDPEDCLPGVISRIESMRGVVPGIRDMELGRNIWDNPARCWDLALSVTFRNMDDFAVYDTHPYHAQMREYIYAHKTDSKTVVYELLDGETYGTAL